MTEKSFQFRKIVKSQVGEHSCLVNNGLEGILYKACGSMPFSSLNYWYTLMPDAAERHHSTGRSLSHKNCISRIEHRMVLAHAISFSLIFFFTMSYRWGWRLKKWDFLPCAHCNCLSPLRAEYPLPAEICLNATWMKLIFLCIELDPWSISSANKHGKQSIHTCLGSVLGEAKGTNLSFSQT